MKRRALLAIACLSVSAPARAEMLYVVQGQQVFPVETTAPAAPSPGAFSISGLAASERLVGMDFRPSTGDLYGVTEASRLYRIDLRRRVATLVGTGPFSPALSAPFECGVDFDPVTGRLRIVRGRRNLTLDPSTGIATEGQGLAYAPGDPHASQNPNVTAVAYGANAAGATAATLYGLDLRDTEAPTLVRIGGVNGTPSADSGIVTTIGPLGVRLDDRAHGFDISGATGTAWATLREVVDATTSDVFLSSVNLATGALTRAGLAAGARVVVRGGKVASSADAAAYRVRAFPELSAAEGSSGDREPSGVFWYATGDYDSPTGFYVPRVHRLAPDGTLTSFTLDGPVSFLPSAVRREAATGFIWALVRRVDADAAYLYRLDPVSSEVIRHEVPFRAFSLDLDPVFLVVWVGGRGNLGWLFDRTFRTIPISDMTGEIAVSDSERLVWLASENGTLMSYAPAGMRIDTYADAADAFLSPGVDVTGAVWGLAAAQDALVRFDPITRVKTRYPLAATAALWARAAVTSGRVALVSSYGPHLLSHFAGALEDGSVATLAAPLSRVAFVSSDTRTPVFRTATRRDSTAPFVERVVYAESDGGRRLFTADGWGYNALVSASAGELLTAGEPLQWWRPLPPHESFLTTAALPVAVEVRPDSPTNFFTELTLTNLDALPGVDLTFRTADADYKATLQVAAGATRVFPSVIQTLKELGAAIPPGTAAGTLTARFTNGAGRLSARVYTRFPDGSTTGLGYTSLDPGAGLFAFRKSLNGLKATPQFRTNVAVSNLCGSLEACTTLEVTASFFDDATGLPVGEVNLSVPPNQWRQADAPLAGFAGAEGETFSVLFVPFSTGVKAYDAYATVIDNVNGDASFVRASAVEGSSNPTLSVVTDAAGVGTRFTSEAAITNTTGGDAVADVTFTSAVSGASVSEVLSLGSGRGVRYPNAVAHFRELDPARVLADDFGPIRIAFRSFATGFASARTVAENGTGLGFTAVDPFRERARRRKRLIGLKETAGFRTNLAVVHLGATTDDPAAPITVKVTVTNSSGQVVGTPLTRTLLPGQLHQWNRILGQVGAAGEGYVATVERTEGRDAYDAYVTTIDNLSSDPTFLRAE